jgi:23S rRNA (guanosine2251-2'-O)-methyltransferase
LAGRGELILALDGIVDPRNVGGLLRTAEATGFRHVVVPQDRAAGITPTVVNASAGAAEHLVVWQEVNLARWLKSAQAASFWVAGLALDSAATPLFDIDLRPPLVLVVGAEGTGLRRLIREACDVLVSIPMYGQVASLNASVAGALAMYEVRRWLEADGGNGNSDAE